MIDYINEVRGAIGQVLEITDMSSITSETELEADLGFDSALFIELIMCLEDRVPNLTIDPTRLRPEDFVTVGTVAGLLAALLQ